MTVKRLADTNLLFQVCKQELSEPVARVASCCLFWSQHAKHKFKGRLAIYKTDKELALEIGKHWKTVGRLLLTVCTHKNSIPAISLFEAYYGSKPYASGGRVRWLIPTPKGHAFIAKALEMRADRDAKKNNAATTKNKTLPPLPANCSDQLPHSVAILSKILLKANPTEVLSMEVDPEKVSSSTSGKELQGEVKRIVSAWNQVCEKNKRVDLIWKPRAVNRLTDDLQETVSLLQLDQQTDADLEKRLTVLCCDLNSIADDVSPSFAKHNAGGLQLKSFALYGPQLMSLAAKFKKTVWKPKINMSEIFAKPSAPLKED